MGICVLLAGLVAAAECGKKWKDLVDLCPWTSPDGYGGYQDGLAREEAFLCKEQLCNPGAPTREAPVCSEDRKLAELNGSSRPGNEADLIPLEAACGARADSCEMVSLVSLEVDLDERAKRAQHWMEGSTVRYGPPPDGVAGCGGAMESFVCIPKQDALPPCVSQRAFVEFVFAVLGCDVASRHFGEECKSECRSANALPPAVFPATNGPLCVLNDTLVDADGRTFCPPGKLAGLTEACEDSRWWLYALIATLLVSCAVGVYYRHKHRLWPFAIPDSTGKVKSRYIFKADRTVVEKLGFSEEDAAADAERAEADALPPKGGKVKQPQPAAPSATPPDLPYAKEPEPAASGQGLVAPGAAAAAPGAPVRGSDVSSSAAPEPDPEPMSR